ncbi:MAG: hypothetical protein GXC76_15835, partial [Rhodanobacteraceae bacterium]|nr:hypothetical protein [Rhodanobacteraceae bacterium]
LGCARLNRCRGKNQPLETRESHNQLFAPFGVSMADALAEERRLFYVAVTRAQHRLLLLTETDQESSYLEAVNAGQRAIGRTSTRRTGTNMGEFAQAVRERLDKIDRMELIRRDISPMAVPWFEHFVSAGLGVPEVGYFFDGFCAELAWPSACPPVAVLSGRHTEHADAWSTKGWRVVITTRQAK